MGKVWRGDSGKEGGREGKMEEYCTVERVERGGNGCGNIDFFLACYCLYLCLHSACLSVSLCLMNIVHLYIKEIKKKIKMEGMDEETLSLCGAFYCIYFVCTLLLVLIFYLFSSVFFFFFSSVVCL